MLTAVLLLSLNQCPRGTVSHTSPGAGLAGEPTVRTACENARGRTEGPSTERYPDGGLAWLSAAHDGVPTGRSQSWYPNGTPRSDDDSTKGQLDGVSRFWFPDGGVQQAGRWSHGAALDAWQFEPSGEPKEHFELVAGQQFREHWYPGEWSSFTGPKEVDDLRLGNALRPCVRASIGDPVTVDAAVTFEVTGARVNVAHDEGLTEVMLGCMKGAVQAFASDHRSRYTYTLRLGALSRSEASRPSVVGQRFARETNRPP